jgi:hypothetical protein
MPNRPNPCSVVDGGSLSLNSVDGSNQTVEKVCCEIACLPLISTQSPHHHHDLHPTIFVCLPISHGCELTETLDAQLVILKQ